MGLYDLPCDILREVYKHADDETKVSLTVCCKYFWETLNDKLSLLKPVSIKFNLRNIRRPIFSPDLEFIGNSQLWNSLLNIKGAEEFIFLDSRKTLNVTCRTYAIQNIIKTLRIRNSLYFDILPLNIPLNSHCIKFYAMFKCNFIYPNYKNIIDDFKRLNVVYLPYKDDMEVMYYISKYDKCEKIEHSSQFIKVVKNLWDDVRANENDNLSFEDLYYLYKQKRKTRIQNNKKYKQHRLLKCNSAHVL